MHVWSNFTPGCVYVWIMGSACGLPLTFLSGRHGGWGEKAIFFSVFIHSEKTEWKMAREEERRRLWRGGAYGVSQLGEIKVGLTFSTPSSPAELPPVPPCSPLSLLPPPLLVANQWAWIPAAAVWRGNNDVLEHKGISRSDERLIWCERESRAACQTCPPSSPDPLLSFPPSPFSSTASHPSKNWQRKQQLGLLTFSPPALSSSFLLFLSVSHPPPLLPPHLRLWAVIPAVRTVQCLTSVGGVCVHVYVCE